MRFSEHEARLRRMIEGLAEHESSRGAPPPGRPDLPLLGRIALELGLAGEDDLERCIREQEESRAAGQEASLEQLLLRRAGLSPGDLAWLLQEQSRRTEAVPGLPGYEVQERLGEGSSAVVYRAWDRNLKRPVALKVMRGRPDLREIDRERFRREAQAAARLSHPNVVAVHEAGERDGRLYLVMEIVEGRPLSALLEAKELGVEESARLVEKAARGVAAAHEKGIVHRDLKPLNILLTPSGEPKVADFGLAHLTDSTVKLTRTGSALGTPLYMAPEQVEGRAGEITPATDVYALGAILYELLAGRPPHIGTSIMEVYRKIVHEDPEPLRMLNAAVPRDLETVALKALAKEPRARYASAGDMADDLSRCLQGRPVSARPEGALGRLWRSIRRHRAAAALITLLATACLGIPAAWWLHGTGLARLEECRAKALSLLESARPALDRATQGLYDASTSHEDVLRAAGEVESLVEQALALAPDLALAHYRRGEAWEIKGYYDEASACWQRARELDPRFGPARYRLGRILVWKAYLASLDLALEPEEMRQAGAEGLASEAVLEIEAARAEGSGFDHALQREVASAMLAYLRKDAGGVRRIGAEGLRRFSGRPGLEEFHWLLGIVKNERKEREDRLAAFNEALRIRPKFPLALLGRARTHHLGKDREAAMRDYDAAILLSPTLAQAYVQRGSLRFLMGDAKGAIEDYESLIRAGRLLPAAYNGRGWSRLRLLGDVDGALADLEQAIRLGPAEYHLPRAARGLARLLKGDLDGALADAERVLRSARLGLAHYVRGKVRSARGDREGALADLKEAVRKSPNDDLFRKDLEALAGGPVEVPMER